MTARRYATTFPTPARTGGEDRPEPACAEPLAEWRRKREETGSDDPWAYDVLVDQTAGPAFHAALRVARDICGGCPLMTACLNANRDEQWARSVLGISSLPEKPSLPGRFHAERNRERAAKLNADRIRAVREVVAANGTINDALRLTKISREAFYTWCRRHHYTDLWDVLTRHESGSRRGPREPMRRAS